jgi:hypothetical protein
MGWLQDWLNETEAAASKKPAPVAPVAREPRNPEPEIKEVWFQISPQRNGDMGMVEPAFYSVVDGVLMMHDASGKPTGKQFHLGPNDDPRKVAGRLGREAWRKANGPTSDFNRPLHYSSDWMA